MGNHRSKTANIREFYVVHNTLLELNEYVETVKRSHNL
jgi:hypothetical protein